VGVVGYVMMVMLLSGLVYAFPKMAEFVIELSVSLIFYGMYFGVLGRDFAELCVDYMAASMKVSKHININNLLRSYLDIDNVWSLCLSA